MALAKELVKERLKDGSSPTYEQDMTLQYVEKFVKLTRAKTEKMVDELKEVEGVDDWLANKIADVLPVEKPVLELLLVKKYKLSDEAMNKILEIVTKFVK